MKASKKSSPTTLYDILGVPRSATAAEIKSAYRSKVLATHPDKIQEQTQDEEPQDFDELGKAYHTLKNPELRAKYDQSLDQDKNPEAEDEDTEEQEEAAEERQQDMRRAEQDEMERRKASDVTDEDFIIPSLDDLATLASSQSDIPCKIAEPEPDITLLISAKIELIHSEFKNKLASSEPSAAVLVTNTFESQLPTLNNFISENPKRINLLTDFAELLLHLHQCNLLKELTDENIELIISICITRSPAIIRNLNNLLPKLTKKSIPLTLQIFNQLIKINRVREDSLSSVSSSSSSSHSKDEAQDIKTIILRSTESDTLDSFNILIDTLYSMNILNESRFALVLSCIKEASLVNKIIISVSKTKNLIALFDSLLASFAKNTALISPFEALVEELHREPAFNYLKGSPAIHYSVYETIIKITKPIYLIKLRRSLKRLQETGQYVGNPDSDPVKVFDSGISLRYIQLITTFPEYAREIAQGITLAVQFKYGHRALLEQLWSLVCDTNQHFIVAQVYIALGTVEEDEKIRKLFHDSLEAARSNKSGKIAPMIEDRLPGKLSQPLALPSSETTETSLSSRIPAKSAESKNHNTLVAATSGELGTHLRKFQKKHFDTQSLTVVFSGSASVFSLKRKNQEQDHLPLTDGSKRLKDNNRDNPPSSGPS